MTVRRKIVKSEDKIPTNCSAYFMPMLFSIITDVPMYKGCFAGDIEKPELSHNIFVLCGFHGQVDQTLLEELMSDSDLFVTLYYPDDYSTMFVYDVPPELDREYMKCIEGKYSEISDWFKKKICRFWGYTEESKYYQILYKVEKRRLILEEELGERISKNAELGTIFSKERDWFQEKYKKKKSGGFESGRNE